MNKYCQVRINQDRAGYINLGGPICGLRASIRHFGYFYKVNGVRRYSECENTLCFCPEHSKQFMDAQAKLF